MKRVFLLMVVSALLVTLGFAQTPSAGSSTDQFNVKGCLGGSDGNYTVAEDGTAQIFKITTSSVDFKPHLGHDVQLIGHKAGGDVSPGAADNSFAVTELNMISEHCAAAAVAPAATVSPSPATASTPPAAAAAPAATVTPSSATASTLPADSAPATTVSPSSATASTPPADAATPATTVSPSSATVSTPPADAATPAATVSPSSATVSTPPAAAAAPSPSSVTVITDAVEDARPTRLSAHHQRVSATQAATATAPAATVSPSSDTVTPPVAAAATPTATASTSSDTVSTPAAAATTPTVTHRGSGLWLFIPVIVLIVVLGTLTPLLGRWRRRKMLERTDAPNLSFTKEVSSEQDKQEPRKVA